MRWLWGRKVRKARGNERPCYVVERGVWVSLTGALGIAVIAWGLYTAANEWGWMLSVRERTAVVETVTDGLAEETEWEEEAAPVWADVRSIAEDDFGITVDLREWIETEGLARADEATATSGEEGWAPAAADAGDGGLSPLYEAFRLERDRLQARQMEAIQRAVEDPEVSEERRWESHRVMLEMLAAREKEVELEYLLRAGGYPDAVVAVRGNYANVVVDGVLDQQGAARIGELVVRVAGVPPERIAIVDGYRGP